MTAGGRGGRPPKDIQGRKPMLVRAPESQVEHYRLQAEARGLSLSSYATMKLAELHGLPIPAYIVAEIEQGQAARPKNQDSLLDDSSLLAS